jgi:hypothetical protein
MEARELVEQRAGCINRIQKVLEDANIKLASVATEVVGKSGWAMLARIVGGEADPRVLAGLARGRLKAKKEQLLEALEGRVTEHHRFLPRQLMKQIRFLDGLFGRVD